MTAAMHSTAADRLKAFLDRIERLEAERTDLGDDVKAVYAELKADGFDPKVVRAMIKRRKKDPAELAEAETLLHSYMVAAGMASDRQLYDAVRAMAEDDLARDEVIDALKLLVPVNGEIVARVGGEPVRIWRDETGNAFVAAYVPPQPAENAGKGLKPSTTVLTLVPKDVWVAPVLENEPEPIE